MPFLIHSPRRLVLRLIGGTLLTAFSVAAIWIGKRYAAYGRIAAELPFQIDAARREGIPLTLDELNTSLHTGATVGKNAAPLYRSLLDGYEARKDKEDAVGAYLMAKPSVNRVDTTEVLSQLATMSEEIAIAEKASRLPRCDWERDWVDSGPVDPFPELVMAHSWVRLFCARAELKSNTGEVVGAFEDLETAARITKHMSQDPGVIVFLLEISCECIVRNRAESILLTHRDNPDVVSAAGRAFATLGPAPDLRRVAGGELVSYLMMMGQARKGKGEAMGVESILPTYFPGVYQRLQDAWDVRSIAFWREVIRCLDNYPADPLSQYQAIQAVESRISARASEPGNELLSIAGPMFGQMALKVLDAEARRRLDSTLVALVAARQKDGSKQWPASLDALPRSDVNQYTDPFTGKPLIYHRTPDGSGFTLYSVGEDFVDNKGQHKETGSMKASDIVISFPLK